MNILQVFKVKVVDTPIVDTRLVLHWTPSSTTCSSSHWLPQSAPQLPLVTLETLCWNIIHVLSHLGSLTGVYSRISSCPKKVGVTFGCTHLTMSTHNRLLAQYIALADLHSHDFFSLLCLDQVFLPQTLCYLWNGKLTNLLHNHTILVRG
jgi:hypothetical protein